MAAPASAESETIPVARVASALLTGDVTPDERSSVGADGAPVSISKIWAGLIAPTFPARSVT